MSQNHLSVLKMLVTIVDRGKGAAAVSLYREQRLHFDYLCMGLGTANSKILDYFGLSETEKDVVITLVPPTACGGSWNWPISASISAVPAAGSCSRSPCRA